MGERATNLPEARMREMLVGNVAVQFACKLALSGGQLID